MTAYVNGSDTSREAAESIALSLHPLQQKVYSALLAAGASGMTDDELEVVVGVSHQTVSARRRELVLAGRLRDSGVRRATRSGRHAVVWTTGAGDTHTEPTTLKKAPSRPGQRQLKNAIVELQHIIATQRQQGYEPSEDLQNLGRWLIHLTKEGA